MIIKIIPKEEKHKVATREKEFALGPTTKHEERNPKRYVLSFDEAIRQIELKISEPQLIQVNLTVRRHN
jgi:hypothetical protein